MEQRAFDGCVIAVSAGKEAKYPADSIGFRAFGHERFDAENFQHAIEDLRATRFEKYTDNFIQVETCPGDLDWFSDSDWENVAHNMKTLARIARRGGCKGLEVDPEEYGPAHLWTPQAWTEEQRKAHSEDECVAMARRRGAQVMEALSSEYPRITMLWLFGPAFTYSRITIGNHRYRLLAPFIDGMCSVARPGARIIDGFEQSYGYRTPISFEDGRKRQGDARQLFEDKTGFDRHMRVGFGLWMDNDSGRLGWHPDEPGKNHFQPDTWQTAIHYALAYSDEYVWVWHERYDLWSWKNLPPAYLAAQVAGRNAPGRITGELAPGTTSIRRAANRCRDRKSTRL